MSSVFEDEEGVNVCNILEFEVGMIRLKSAIQVCNLDPESNKAFREVF